MKFPSRFRSLKPRRERMERQCRPSTEQFEVRQLMAANAFLQGTSFVDANGNGKYDMADSPLQGATIALYRKTSPSTVTQIGTAVTGADGGYYFDDATNLNSGQALTAGDYRLVEFAPGTYTSNASQALSLLNPASSVDAKTIDVTITNPDQIWGRIDAVGSQVRVSYSLTGAPRDPVTDLAGTYNISLGTTSGNPTDISGSYNSFCTNALEQLGAFGDVFQLTPKPETQPNLNFNGHGSQIAFLYNNFISTYGTSPSASIPAQTAAAYQIAIWELVHDSAIDLNSGNFRSVAVVNGSATDTANLLAEANSLLSQSTGRSGHATYLEAVAITGSRQSQLAPGSLNFGNVAARPSSLSGYVYYDANNDGSRAGEAPISGASIKLTGTDDLGAPVSLTTTTDGTGLYTFGNLRPGTYTITETQPSGYLDGKDTVGTPGGTTGNDVFSNIVLGAGVNGTENNFGEVKAASLSGYVYYDANNDGSRAGEAPIVGATVKLTGTDDLGAPVSLTTTTDGTGLYTFGNLRPGTYTIAETQPAGYLDGKDTIGTPGGTTTNDVFSSIVLGAGVNGTENNFGEVKAASIAGFVYYDLNNDGTFQGTESPITGATVTLTGTDDLGAPVSLTTTTGATGLYSFGNLRPGTYVLTETQPAGYLDGKDTVGTPGGTTTNDKFSNIVLGAGVNGVNNNFGEVKAASLSGYVYYDSNNDGNRTGETPITGATVTLTGTDDLGASVSLTTTTDGTGLYSFGNLRPGTYVITETQPAGYLDGKDTIGTPGGVTANDKFSNIVLAAGVNGVENNFGEVKAASISGYVYVDANNDGTFQSTELPIKGVTVTLTGTTDAGAVSLTTTTDANGFYVFNSLLPGTYVVTETQPVAYNDGKDTLGSPFTGTVANDVFSNVAIFSGGAGVNYNFGELNPVVIQPPGSISGKKVIDVTGNGLSSDDTAPTVAFTIKLYKDVNNNGSLDSYDTLVTSTNTTVGGANPGSYSFSNLPVGNYLVKEIVPAGYVRTAPTYNDYYSVSVTSAAPAVQNLNFANFKTDCCGDPCNLYFLIYSNGCSTPTKVYDLRGNVDQGDLVKAVFTVPYGETDEYTLVSYTAPQSYFDANRASDQKIFDTDTGTFSCGTYSLTVEVPNSNFQIDFVCGKAIDKFGPAGSNIFYTPQGRLISADNDGCNAPLANPGSLFGNVYVDVDQDGIRDSGEKGIANVPVYLTGTVNYPGSSYAQSISLVRFTDSNGKYDFKGLPKGTYKIVESQPSGYNSTRTSVGTINGIADGYISSNTSNTISSITLGEGEVGTDYNYGELVTKNICSGQTATSYYWKTWDGQNLIKCFNGGGTSCKLGNWLASCFPNLYGSSSACNLANKTNSEICNYYMQLCNSWGKDAERECFASALNCYATTSWLGGKEGCNYGFSVCDQGLGGTQVNVGCYGGYVGCSNYSDQTVYNCLKMVNDQSSGGSFCGGSSSRKSAVYSMFNGVNCA